MEPSLRLVIPDDEMLQAAVGRVALRHGQLEHVLRLTVKSIQKMDFQKGMRATRNQSSYQLRQRIRKLFEKIAEERALVELDELLERAREVTDRRNKSIHNLWARTKGGDLVIRDDDAVIRRQPTTAEMDTLANEIAAVTAELNEARLRGFIMASIPAN